MSILTKELIATGKSLDFRRQEAKTLDTINSDVSKATNGLIDNLLEQISNETVLILVNAIYFKGLWKKSFCKMKQTKKGNFVLH